ncbi:MAG TPA: DUF5336 domain-containing protein [Jatrophihabitans sp.]|uniref:DUF5336 domain-containing protein n=1 Tax=Jatrophihabitans sp. TaxID=1932789 RepID=UPI002F04A130
MSANDSTSRNTSSTAQRERMLSMVAGALGILMFIWGFLKWLEFGEGDESRTYSGYAFQMPTTAIIGFSLAAGLVALLGATERRRGRGVPSAIPTALAATSLLLAVGVYLGKGSISNGVGDEVGVQIGLILGLLTALLQTVVLGMGLASRHDEGDDYDRGTATGGGRR